MELNQTQVVMLVVVAAVAWKLLDLGTAYFFKRITRDDVVTNKDCETNRLNCSISKDVKDLKETTGDLCNRTSEIRGIMLVVAIKAGINPEELKDLTKVG